MLQAQDEVGSEPFWGLSIVNIGQNVHTQTSIYNIHISIYRLYKSPNELDELGTFFLGI